mgnify:CR=1 FL=1
MEVATLALGKRLELIAAEYLRTRYSGPGNPMGARILHAAPLTVTRVAYVPQNSQMNGAHGVESVEDFRRVCEFYEDQSFWIDVTPSVSPKLLATLGPSGFRPESFTSVLHASPIPKPIEHAIAVEVIARRDLDVFLDTINVGFGVSEDVLDVLSANQSFWSDVPNWRLLLARVVGEPAGAAVLAISGKSAYLAAAATLPRFRGTGVHTALIAERLKLAKAAGCSEVTGQADAGSTSQCNQQRAGLGIVHTKCIWTNTPLSGQM